MLGRLAVVASPRSSDDRTTKTRLSTSGSQLIPPTAPWQTTSTLLVALILISPPKLPISSSSPPGLRSPCLAHPAPHQRLQASSSCSTALGLLLERRVLDSSIRGCITRRAPDSPISRVARSADAVVLSLEQVSTLLLDGIRRQVSARRTTRLCLPSRCLPREGEERTLFRTTEDKVIPNSIQAQCWDTCPVPKFV